MTTPDRPVQSDGSVQSDGPDHSDRPDRLDLLDTDKVAKALPFFRLMAFVVGVGLLVLVLEMVLKYGFGNDVLAWWAMPHGFLYMLYLGATANLGFASRWPLPTMIGVMLAGCVPFLSFVVEHRVTRSVQAVLTSRSGTMQRVPRRLPR